jgi:hypothetical protein
MDSLFHEILNILEVPRHSFLEILLTVSDLNPVQHLAMDLVEDDQNSANASILTFASVSGVSTST